MRINKSKVAALPGNNLSQTSSEKRSKNRALSSVDLRIIRLHFGLNKFEEMLSHPYNSWS